MTGTQDAQIQTADDQSRHLVLIATVGTLSIGLILWSFYAGALNNWGTPLVLFSFLLNGAILMRFILRQIRRTQGGQR